MRKLVRSLRLIIPMSPLVAMFLMSPVRAEDRIVVQSPTDFWFEFVDATQFLAVTFQSDGYPSDPQLWLYDAGSGELILTNDDFLGLQSRIDVEVPAGAYRLRASTCCYEPDVWRTDRSGGFNVRYELSFNGVESVPVTTTEPDATTTTEVINETTTTVEETTTTSDAPATSSSTSTTSPAFSSSTTSSSVAVPTTEVTTSTTTEPDATTTTEPETTTSSVFVPLPPVATTTSSTSVAPPTQTTTTEVLLDSVTTTVEPDATVPDEPVDIPVDSSLPDEIEEPDSPLITDDFIGVSVEEIVAELSVDKLEALTDDEVVALIDGIASADLTDEQADAIAVALSDAPDDVKEEFESEVDVFLGQFDSYVALDSLISVGKRRVVIAVTATALVLPASASRGGGSRKGKK